jgi:hypothetical protein
MAAGRVARSAVLAFAVCVAAWACGSGSTPSSTTPTPTPTPSPTAAKRLLVVTYTAGFHHDSIPVAEATIQSIGARNGIFQTEFCRTADEVKTRLTADGLQGFDGVFFANTTGNLGIPDVRVFLDWIAAGHAFLGAHSASDTYHESPEYIAMLGGEFDTHGAIVPGDIRVDDPSDPSVSHLAPRFTITDELYRFSHSSRASVHVLLSMDRVPPDGVGTAGTPADLLMAWRRDYGAGRVFYTALGHRNEVWQDARFQQHLLGGLRWALQL